MVQGAADAVEGLVAADGPVVQEGAAIFAQSLPQNSSLRLVLQSPTLSYTTALILYRARPTRPK